MKPLREVPVYPTLFTLANLICGFFAIVVASRVLGPTAVENFDVSPTVAKIGIRDLLFHTTTLDPTIATYNFLICSWLIFLAMVFDALDGRVARLTRQTSDFGGQLDSLCDLVTFGAAPAFLMVKMCPSFTMRYQHSVWLIAAAFVCCAALRLARFNVENDENEDHLWFVGLPVPAAAAAIAGNAVVFYTLRLENRYLIDTATADLWIQYSLPIISLILSLLMVSRIPYPHAMSQLFRGGKSFAHVVALMFGILPIILFPGYVIPALAMLYAMIPPLYFGTKKLMRFIARRREKTA